MAFTLAWDANPSGDNVTGYKLYFGSAPGTYDGSGSPISMGNVTSYRLNVAAVRTYYSITAVNAQGESGHSSELYKP